jgi:xanthine dehydrogenase accessory factor
MISTVQSVRDFLAGDGRVALVEVSGTRGSTPREKGAFMLVSQAATFGTIGGGQLEYMAIDKARQMLISPQEEGMAKKRPEGVLSGGATRASSNPATTSPLGSAATIARNGTHSRGMKPAQRSMYRSVRRSANAAAGASRCSSGLSTTNSPAH